MHLKDGRIDDVEYHVDFGSFRHPPVVSYLTVPGASRHRWAIPWVEFPVSAVPVFDYAFTVSAPLDAVREFHRDTRALKRLTPPPVFVRLHRVEPLAEGSVSEFTLWVGPLPLRWTAVHRDVGERGFTDVQVAGPAAAWAHTHSFEPLDAGRTRIREHIEFEHKPGPIGLVTRILFAKPNLLAMFFYRSLVTRFFLRARR